MSSYTSYSIDETTRFLVEDKDGNERVITDLGGNHDLTRTYIRLALQIWKPEQIGKASHGFCFWRRLHGV